MPLRLALPALAAAALTGCASLTDPVPTATVTPARETVRVAGSGDAADDPALWVAPDPAQSLILGTDKTAGLYVFELSGDVRQFLPAGRLNNVDVRDGFPFEGRAVPLVAATNRTTRTLDLFVIDPETREVSAPPGGSFPLDFEEPYGVCLYAAPDGTFHVGAGDKEGAFVQFEVAHDENGFTAIESRRLDLGSITEGCVFDDRTGDLFIGEENVGIWRYPADPAAGDARVSVAEVNGREFVADIEGLTIYPQGEDGGYLIASVQGDNAYAFFRLPQADYVGRIRALDNGEAGIDGTTETDGIHVSNAALPGFPAGVLIVQDDVDDEGGQNFKLIDWADIAAALGLE